MRTNQNQSVLGWIPFYEEAPSQAQRFAVKAKRCNKLARDMRDKVRARRAEDRHIMELAEYHHPFMEA